MDGNTLARIGAVIFIAVAVTAMVIDMTRKDDAPEFSPAPIVQPQRDPLREGQLRCQQLGQRAADDPECLRVWAETRDRFLGHTRAPSAPASTSSEGH